MNKVMLMGNIGTDPEFKHTSNSKKLTFRLATSKKWKDSSGALQEKTSWHNCVIWGKRAEALASILNKGTKVLVEGELDYNEYDDPSGVRRYWSGINVQSLEFASARKEGGGGSGGGSGGGGKPRSSGGYGGGQPEAEPPDDLFGPGGDDDIPF